jgi:microcystin-dependent protein
MIRRLSIAIVALLALTAQLLAAGSIQLSLSQQFDAQGRPLSGGQLYFFTAGTTTPQNAFQDTALTITYPNPITLDASGRVPPFYLADGLIKIRLATSAGVTVIAADNLLVVGASSGGGGGGSIDVTTILATGDVKARYGTGTLTGFVRMNGRTIGSATSGATERANADAQTLFEYLWNTDPNISVSGGRGASSIADWTANKTLALPDMRGRTIAGMDDMGNTAANILTSTFFGAVATTLGNAGGTQSVTLTLAQSPAHSHLSTGSTNNSTADHTHSVGSLATTGAGGFTPTVNGSTTFTPITSGPGGTNISGTGSAFGLQTFTFDAVGAHTHPITGITGGLSLAHLHTITGLPSDTQGGGGAHATIMPARVMTFYIKL